MAVRDSSATAEVLRGNTDTSARDSVLAAEVLRGNDDTTARVSSVAIEVLRDKAQGIVFGDDAEVMWIGGPD